jgi:hypothetical protein
MAWEKAVREHAEVEVSPDKAQQVTSLESELDELEGRLALRLGTTHPDAPERNRKGRPEDGTRQLPPSTVRLGRKLDPYQAQVSRHAD